MTMPAAPAGWSRFLVKSRFAVGRDFVVLDPQTEEQLYLVDGKIGPRPQAEVRANDDVLYRVKGALFDIPKRLTITDAGGAEVAVLRAKMFSPIRNRMELEMRSGGPWTLEGALIEKNYTVMAGGEPIVAITQKWVTLRDTYTLDLAAGIDPGLALAVLWAVDRWVEGDG